MYILLKGFVALIPLLCCFVVAWLVMDGHLNFGGGEKDVFLIIPLLLWSLLFFCCYLALWWRGRALLRSLAVSAGFATSGVLCAWLVLVGVTWYRYG